LRGDGQSARWVPVAGVSNWQEIKSARATVASIHKQVKAIDESHQLTRYVLKPWRHQLQGTQYLMDMWSRGEGAMLEYGMGTGKTKITIDALQNMFADGCSVLVVCPKSVIPNWGAEIKKHGCAGVFDVLLLTKGTVESKSKKAIEFLGNRDGKIKVAVVNYESCWREGFHPVFKGGLVDVMVGDELHKIKSGNSEVSKYLSKAARTVKHIVGLTGTPMPHSPLDIFGQYRALCPDVFGTSFVRFRSRYAIMGGFEGRQVVGYSNQDELRQKYLSHALQCGRDVLELPDKHHIEVPVQLSAATRKAYDVLNKEMTTMICGGTVTAANALTKLLRLAQITGGSVPVTNDDDSVHVTQVGSEKAEALEDLLDGLAMDEPVVVFCRFRADLDQIRRVTESLGRKYGELSGRVNSLDQWQRGQQDVLGVQIQAGGVGIDLTRACYVVYWSVGYSLGEYEQSLARAHRPGQDRTVTVYHLIAENTVDGKIYKALDQKKDIIQSILSDVKGEIK
jgi:SNF2 family DNA or RNA helicase